MASGMNGLQRSSGAVPGDGPLAAAAYELQPVDPAAELRRLAGRTGV